MHIIESRFVHCTHSWYTAQYNTIFSSINRGNSFGFIRLSRPDKPKPEQHHVRVRERKRNTFICIHKYILYVGYTEEAFEINWNRTLSCIGMYVFVGCVYFCTVWNIYIYTYFPNTPTTKASFLQGFLQNYARVLFSTLRVSIDARFACSPLTHMVSVLVRFIHP